MNLKLNKKSGFTLLEVIIVIIIIGVLASLALPRFFATVEYSRSSEALNSFVTLRDSMERCSMAVNPPSYATCDLTSIDAEDPTTAPNSHFGYAIDNTTPANGYTITATRNTLESGTNTDMIQLVQDPTLSPAITRTGTTAFKGIK